MKLVQCQLVAKLKVLCLQSLRANESHHTMLTLLQDTVDSTKCKRFVCCSDIDGESPNRNSLKCIKCVPE
eukprot:s793_g15.t1